MEYDVRIELPDENKRVKAREMTDFSYFTELVGSAWTCTPTDGQFDRYDATATCGNTAIIAEFKGRDISLGLIPVDDGIVIDCEKVNAIKEQVKAYETSGFTAYGLLFFFFHQSNTAVIANVKNSDSWKICEFQGWKSEKRDSQKKAKVYKIPVKGSNRRWMYSLTEYPSRLLENYKNISDN